ncbi:hypothetical protein JNX05_08505 [Pseudosulfitobacter pseudonitzschiae]|nr:hypothetical protein JNX05_08505 [Pseudosulfitobacter pseudonitzschiae]
MNTEMTEPQMPEKEMVGGMIGKMFPNLTADRLDRISLALMSLSGYPTPGMESLMQGAQQRIGDRREEKSNQQRNSKTAEMLRSNGAPDYLVQAAMNGYGSAALSQYMQIKGRKPDARTPYSDQAKIASDLRNGWITPEQAQQALAGGGNTEADREIARLESVGIPRNIAIKIKEGVYKTTQDPLTREVTVIDISTGQPVYQATGTPAPAPSDALDTTPTPTGADASDSFGLEGMIKRAINSGSDFIGAGTPFEGVRDTQSDFAVLREGLVNDISQGYGRQPPSWLMKNIQDLTPSAGGGSGCGGCAIQVGRAATQFRPRASKH